MALFDTLQEKVGQESRSGVPIYDIQELRDVASRQGHHDRGHRRAGGVGPAGVVGTVVDAGIKAVLNFSPGALRGPARRQAEERGPDGFRFESLSFYLASLESGARN